MINSCQVDTKFCLNTGRENNEDGENCNPKSPLYYRVKLYSIYGAIWFTNLSYFVKRDRVCNYVENPNQ
ncbi:hypothetical protein L1887_23715 [Cichorium endivia]|nr:hypothetical protein L1887_23715 [Cichorium endivia]